MPIPAVLQSNFGFTSGIQVYFWTQRPILLWAAEPLRPLRGFGKLRRLMFSRGAAARRFRLLFVCLGGDDPDVLEHEERTHPLVLSNLSVIDIRRVGRTFHLPRGCLRGR